MSVESVICSAHLGADNALANAALTVVDEDSENCSGPKPKIIAKVRGGKSPRGGSRKSVYVAPVDSLSNCCMTDFCVVQARSDH